MPKSKRAAINFNLPSFKDVFHKVVNKTTAKWAGIGALFTACAVDGGLLYNWVKPNQFGMRTTLGSISPEALKPGPHFHIPFIQYTHDYGSQVQTIRMNAGGLRFFPAGESTEDRNHISSDVVLNYRVKPDFEKLAFHRWEMNGFVMQDGYWLLTRLMNDSANAVLGKKSMDKTLADPEEYARAFYEDLTFRFDQNNVPVHIESIEVKGFKTTFPTKSVSYSRVANPKVSTPVVP